MRAQLILILCLCAIAPRLNASPDNKDDKNNSIPYISPGVSLGYTFGSGAHITTQLTLGLLLDQMEPPIPGITVGRRFSKQSTITFVDIQVSYLLAGVGYGKAWVKPDSTAQAANLHHFKGWAGMLGLVQYDYFHSTAMRLHSLSGTVVLPIPARQLDPIF